MFRHRVWRNANETQRLREDERQGGGESGWVQKRGRKMKDYFWPEMKKLRH